MFRPLTIAVALLALAPTRSAADTTLIICPAMPLAVWDDGRELRVSIEIEPGMWIELPDSRGQGLGAFELFQENCAEAERIAKARAPQDVADGGPHP